MANTETLPQSIVDITTVILKPRLDVGAVNSMAEDLKHNLFSKSMFKPKPEETQLIFFEAYYEPYLVIGGTYSLDYCKKHTFNLDVDKKIGIVYIAGQEFRSQSTDTTGKNVIEVTGEEHAHYQKQTFFILDRMNREISPEKLPFTPFSYKKEECNPDNNFKKIPISREVQIDFLKSKIALRPPDVAAIIKEIFEITDRTIVYNPMYELTFENAKKRKEACVLINGVTGEITVKTLEKQISQVTSTKTNNKSPDISSKPNIQPEPVPTSEPFAVTETTATQKVAIIPNEIENIEEKYTPTPQPTKIDTNKESVSFIPNIPTAVETTLDTTEESMILGFPAKIHGEVFSVGDRIAAIVGDIDITSGSNINKTLVVKGTLKIGDNCRANGKLKALQDITIGADTVIDGDVIAGGNVFVGTRSIINGSVEATGSVQLSKHVTVEKGLHSNQTETRISTEIEVIVDTEKVIASVER